MTTARVPDAIPEPPRGWRRVTILGPAFLWMVSATGAGELLFTPRIGAQYGYALLWALLAAVVLKWFVNHEVGRVAVCTGSPILEGFARLPGPGRWALWLILVPQLVVAVSITAGIAASASTAAILMLPGSATMWTIALILLTGAVVWYGRYGAIQLIATLIALVLGVAGVAGGAAVIRGGELAAGLAPTLPPDVDFGEVLPWLGFMLAGAAGIMWYSYWLVEAGYGVAPNRDPAWRDPAQRGPEERQRLRGWVRQMGCDNVVAVVGTLLPTIGFLILGAELLDPNDLPAEDRVADTLSSMLGRIWGSWGRWLLIIGMFVGFTGTLLSLQDGFGRLYAHGTRLLLPERSREGRWAQQSFLRRGYVLVLTVALPIALYLIAGEPVRLLRIAGAVEAAHLPIVAGLALWLGRRLPSDLRPSMGMTLGAAAAALFFAAFALAHLWQLTCGRA